ncbi:SPOR and LysM peptidoglycan-binding domain-containing protein [Psychrobacter sp. LV10R520-6]|uniref:SPOR and LysM peptidoglycan-binding domain-containing protein n=1 Tax=Psychrobacter sp. LV10R520-6 TaxID=1415574 RepID=UPI0024CBB766|nr:LysM peptidoglycan-binding domain-containing protein [Psychrobacter sp. LV10R520-6]SNT69101.1 Sporulation related domain-containing protein [Psychrobacter sp. LV10R520-6]
MNFSRQALLGIGMIIGGSVMLYAMLQQIGAGNDPEPTPAMVDKPRTEQASSQPLTIDIETEKRILAQKQKERAARVAEQEKRAQQFLMEQETAEAQALAKARAENQQYVENSTSTGGDSDSPEAAQNTSDGSQVKSSPDNTATNASLNDSDKSDTQKEAQALAKQKEVRKQAELKKQAEAKKLAESKKQAEAREQADAKRQAEAQATAKQKKQAEEKAAIEASKLEAAKSELPKSPTDYTVKSGDGLIKLARQNNMSVEALAQANNIASTTSLQVGQALTIPSRMQVQRLERDAANAQQAREDKRDAQEKLREARKEVKETDAKGSFGVQVALANNQTTADEMAKKFKSAGYQVKTSATSRGVRVIVGPERGKVAALALKDKINSDSKVNTTGAWVLYWR